MCAQCNDDEIYVIAEQILLEGKTLSDFKGLEEDDQKKIQAIVNRGVKSLSEHNSTKTELAKRKKTAPVLISRHTTKTAYIYKPKRKTFDISALASKLDLKPFSLEEIAKSTEVSHRRAITELSRKLSLKELGLLLAQQPEWVLNTFLAAMSANQAQELHRYLDFEEEDLTPLELELTIAKSSIALTKLFFHEEVSESLKAYVNEYLLAVTQQLKGYSQKLFVKLGFPEELKELNENDWKRLAGITPRNDMAILSYSLPKEDFEALTLPLPPAQHENVMGNITKFQEHLSQDIAYYGEIIDILVKWLSQVKKIKADSD